LEFAKEAADTGRSASITNPAYHDWTRQDFDRQLAAARRLLTARLAAYEAMLGRRPRSVLEIGCGSGAYAQAFRELGLEYMAVELEPEMAAFARDRTGANIVAGDFAQTTPDSAWAGSWDIIFFSQVLEHVVDPRPFLRQVHRSAGGLVHLDVPNQDGIAALYRKMRHPNCYGSIEAPHHLLGYNRIALAKLLRSAGFDPLLLRSFRNDHSVWGQLYTVTSWKWRLYYAGSHYMDRASLLTAVCRVSRAQCHYP
jgi:2-polyprenyl-3-methyl-5-hydroxy-6-metoxy-1,4-benzoquinol methylase